MYSQCCKEPQACHQPEAVARFFTQVHVVKGDRALGQLTEENNRPDVSVFLHAQDRGDFVGRYDDGPGDAILDHIINLGWCQHRIHWIDNRADAPNGEVADAPLPRVRGVQRNHLTLVDTGLVDASEKFSISSFSALNVKSPQKLVPRCVETFGQRVLEFDPYD